MSPSRRFQVMWIRKCSSIRRLRNERVFVRKIANDSSSRRDARQWRQRRAPHRTRRVANVAHPRPRPRPPPAAYGLRPAACSQPLSAPRAQRWLLPHLYIRPCPLLLNNIRADAKYLCHGLGKTQLAHLILRFLVNIPLTLRALSTHVFSRAAVNVRWMRLIRYPLPGFCHSLGV